MQIENAPMKKLHRDTRVTDVLMVNKTPDALLLADQSLGKRIEGFSVGCRCAAGMASTSGAASNDEAVYDLVAQLLVSLSMHN